jgi:hypothetical protein
MLIQHAHHIQLKLVIHLAGNLFFGFKFNAVELQDLLIFLNSVYLMEILH